MGVEWFCNISGDVAGPFSAQQVQQFAQQGRLAPHDLVAHGPNGPWTTAGNVQGLFPSTAKPAADLPVAQPLDPASARAARPSTARPASAAPPSSSTADPFAIQTDAPKSAGRTPTPGPRKKDRLRTYLINGSIGLFIVGLVSVAILVDPSMNRSEEESASNRTAKQSAEENVDVSLDGPLDKPTEPRPEEPAAKPQESAEPRVEEEVQWLSSDPSLQIGGVRVEVVSAEIGPARIIDQSGEATEYGADFLTVTIDLQNSDESDPLTYTSWGKKLPANDGVSLTDSQGKGFRRFRPSKHRIEGQLAGESVALSTSTRDVLVFQSPADRTGSLHLQLPCAAFGKAGTLRLEIPPELVRVVEESSGLRDMGLGGTDTTIGDMPNRTPDIYDENYDPDGDVSKINRDIEELGGGEQDAAERAFERSDDFR